MPNSLSYKKSGVDIDAAERFIENIKPFVKKTTRPEVVSTIGHYASLFEIDPKKYRAPLLVASTDGVGTKVKLAVEWDRLEGIGQDLVAMSANDILCMGAEPLFFLDYFATGKLDVAQATIVLKGVAEACEKIGAALVGGETAEMPNIYRGKDFDLAGFVVGVVEKDELVDGSKVIPGDVVIGIASSGVHSNGFSLVRKIVHLKKLDPKKKYPGLEAPLAQALLAPTKLYIKTVLGLKKKYTLKALAHITGGGLSENLPRVYPETCRAVLNKKSWPEPALFQWIRKWGKVADDEMHRVFNCGIGMTMIVSASEASDILKSLADLGEKAWIIGEMVHRKKGEDDIAIL
jgi:phosphoribosylformylglycinamidine cyclo-ligase